MHSVIVTFQPKDLENFTKILSSEAGIALTRAYPGCIEASVFQDESEFRILSVWNNKKDWDSYLAFRQAEYLPLHLPLLVKPPLIQEVGEKLVAC